MIKENRVSKYILYALGEVILVVIGILIALQVSDWNEQRKRDNTNNQLLEKLVGELNLNIERAVYLDSLASKNGQNHSLSLIISNTDTAIQYLQSDLSEEQVIWLLETPKLIASSFNLHNSVYNEMINTGRLYSLASDSLVHSIDKYYRRIEREAYYGDARNKSAVDYYQDCKLGFGLLNMDYNLIGASAIKEYPWIFDRRSNEFLKFKAFVQFAAAIMKTNQFRLREIVTDSEKLIEKIELEVKAINQ